VKSSGFTLIELLLVLAIIGIISAIAIPALLGQRESARNKATAANAAHARSTLVTAIGDLDKPAAARPDDLAAATTVADVLTAISGRTIFDASQPIGAKNPFDSARPAYRFNSPAPTAAGEVSLSVPTPNANTGELEIILGYGIRVKGVVDLTPQLISIDAAQ